MKLPFVALAAVAFCGMAAAADPQLMNLVMPDAKVLAGINVQQAKASPFGQYLLSQAQSNDTGLQELIGATGFDPRRDLSEVLFASTGRPGNHQGLAVVRGNFDVARILQAARNKGQTPQLYQGVQILNNPDNSQSLAFLDGTLAVAGNAGFVRGAIDRRTAPAALDPVLVAKANGLSVTQSAWFVSLVPGAGMHAPLPPDNPAGAQANVLQKIQQASGGVLFGPNVLLTAEAVAATSQDATALADVIRFVASMAQYQARQNNTQVPADLLQNLDVKTAANITTVSLSIPEDRLEQLVHNPPHGAGPRHRQVERQ
ncbi:MAG TPA: hypothetical protein VFA33_09695 [Bryobacteraceae bacterium]|nr:hypothetical protein [Bryobacteraceae bacterium]